MIKEVNKNNQISIDKLQESMTYLTSSKAKPRKSKRKQNPSFWIGPFYCDHHLFTLLDVFNFIRDPFLISLHAFNGNS